MATEDGRIWSNYKGRFLKPWLSKAGYQRVTIRGKTFFVHRLVAMAYLDNPDNKPHINHKDSDRANNRVANLEWCTPKENVAHSMMMGTKMQGERHNFAKLKLSQVLEIRQRLKDGEKPTPLAREYGVTYILIWRIKTRDIWKRV